VAEAVVRDEGEEEEEKEEAEERRQYTHF